MMGLKDGEKPLTTISEIARQNINWIKQIQFSGPYKLIGFSFGGLVIYEMIRQIESAGDRVDYAAILDVSANVTAALDYGEALVGVGCRLLEKLGIIMNPYPGWILNLKEALSGMRREEAIEYMICVLREKIGYSSEDVDFWIRVLEVTINNVLSIGPISGRINGELTIVRAAEANWDGADHDLGWSKHASHVEVFTVPGTHNQVLHNGLDKILEHMDQKFQLKNLN
jgi:thioesterase domain-containing protein